MVEINQIQSPIGRLSILAVEDSVVKISFENKSLEEMEKWCCNSMGIKAVEGIDFTSYAISQVLHYLIGQTLSLDFPVVHRNTLFRTKVIDVQRKIPYGETRSYLEVAQMVGNPKAFRAVGSANAENPLPLYFPCHRIICSDECLGGFSGGLEIKKWLLNLEDNRY